MQETRVWSWLGQIPWRRKWQPTPVFLPGKSHEERSLVGYSPWGHKELDMTEHAHTHLHLTKSPCTSLSLLSKTETERKTPINVQKDILNVYFYIFEDRWGKGKLLYLCLVYLRVPLRDLHMKYCLILWCVYNII